MVVSTSLWLKAGVGNLHSLTALYVGQLLKAGSPLHPMLKAKSVLLLSVIQPQSRLSRLSLNQSYSMAYLALFLEGRLIQGPI